MIFSTGHITGQAPNTMLPQALEHLRARDPAPAVPAEHTFPEEKTVKVFVGPGRQDPRELEPLLPAGSRVIVSIGLEFNDDTPLTAAQVDTMGAVLSTAAARGCTVGVADMSAVRLKQAQAALAPLAVSVDQIDATECCALPPDILGLAKHTGVELLAHHDPLQVLSADQAAQLARTTGHSVDKWSYLVRIVCAFNERKVLAGTEYILVVENEN